MIEELNRMEESAIKSTYKLGVGFERCENKCEKSTPKFVPSSNYHKEEETIKSTKTHYPSNLKLSFNPKREIRKETPKPKEEAFICMFCDHASHMDEFCFRCKRIEKRRLDYARNSYRNDFIGFCLILLLMLRLISFMDLTIAHIILVHERIVLCLDALVSAHVLIVVIVPRVGTIFLVECLILTLSPDTWTDHIFSVMVHIPLTQMVRCKGLCRLPQVVWLSAGFLRFFSLTPILSHRPSLTLCR
jgi:hypothetical protein